MKLIGFSGKIGSGKTYLSERVAYCYGATPLYFADLLKINVVAMGKATVEEVTKTKPTHIRKTLQIIGTEIARDMIHPDFWIRGLDAMIQIIGPRLKTRIFIIPDVRFPNEANWITYNNGLLIRLNAQDRTEEMHEKYGTTEEQKKHYSETALDNYPFVNVLSNVKDCETSVISVLFDLVDKYLRSQHA